MGFPMLKKLAIAIALIDLFLAVHDGRNAGRFFLLLTVSSTFDIVPDNIVHKHCEDEFLMNPSNDDKAVERMCRTYADILSSRTRRPINLFSLKNNYVNNPNVSIYFGEDRKHSCWKPEREAIEEDIKNEDKGNNMGEDESETHIYTTDGPLQGQGQDENHQDGIKQLKSSGITKISMKNHQTKSSIFLRRTAREISENQQQVLVNSKMTVTFANATISKESFPKLVTNDSSTGKSTVDKKLSTVLKVKHILNSGKPGEKYPTWRIKSGKDTMTQAQAIVHAHQKEFSFTLIKRYPKLVTKFIEEGMLLQWPCVVSSTQTAFSENNISSVSSPEAQKIKFRIDVDPFRLDVIRESQERLVAVQQLLYDHPWLVVYNLHSKLPGAFTRVFVVITVYTWLWGTVIALMLLIGALTDDQTTLHGWIIFNILYSLLQFMMDQWIHNNITPYKSRLVIWLFLVYSVYKPMSALIGFSRWSDCAAKKATWIFPDGVLSIKTDRKNTITVGIHDLITDIGDSHAETEDDCEETKQNQNDEMKQVEKI